MIVKKVTFPVLSLFKMTDFQFNMFYSDHSKIFLAGALVKKSTMAKFVKNIIFVDGVLTSQYDVKI